MQETNQTKLATHIIVLNYFSFIFISIGIFTAYYFSELVYMRILYFSLWLYLIPPLLARLIILFFGRPTGIVSTDSRTHAIWWVLFQLQLIFNRFPFLEEVLRVIPGVYALWLNLWGGKVNMFSFWAPSVTVMDRYHLVIDKGVILGADCLLSAHVLFKKSNGEKYLVIDQLEIESDALIGVRSMLSPGCHIHASQIVPALRLLKPYTEIKDGKKTLLRSINYK